LSTGVDDESSGSGFNERAGVGVDTAGEVQGRVIQSLKAASVVPLFTQLCEETSDEQTLEFASKILVCSISPSPTAARKSLGSLQQPPCSRNASPALKPMLPPKAMLPLINLCLRIESRLNSVGAADSCGIKQWQVAQSVCETLVGMCGTAEDR
jgi:hypothetical protein